MTETYLSEDSEVSYSLVILLVTDGSCIFTARANPHSNGVEIIAETDKFSANPLSKEFTVRHTKEIYEEDIKLPPTKDGYEWIMTRFPSGDWHMKYTQEGRTKGKLAIEEDGDNTIGAVRKDGRKSKKKGRKKRMEIVDEGA
jgi:hypothetical protein